MVVCRLSLSLRFVLANRMLESRLVGMGKKARVGIRYVLVRMVEVVGLLLRRRMVCRGRSLLVLKRVARLGMPPSVLRCGMILVILLLFVGRGVSIVLEMRL